LEITEFEPRAVLAANVVGDSRSEVLLAQGLGQASIELRDPVAGGLLWESEPLIGEALAPFGIAVANLDGDPAVEVLGVGAEQIGVFSTTGAKERQIAVSGVNSFALADADGNAFLDVVVGEANGRLRAVNPRTGAVGPAIVEIFNENVMAVANATGLRGPGVRDIVFSTGNYVRLLDLATSTVVWTSDELADPLDASTARLAVADIDHDGVREIVLSRRFRIDVFELAQGLIFADGFEWGTSGRWSSSGD
jgi:hypothetical protein